MTLLPIIFAFFVVMASPVVLAADEDLRTEPPSLRPSAFGTLSDEKSQNRTVLDMHGRSPADYKRLLQEYRDINTNITRSYGTQRTALQEQSLARAKDVLLAKLGAAETHLKNLIQRLGSLNLLSEGDRQILNSELASFQGFMNEAKADVEAAETLTALKTLSLEINREVLESLGIANYYSIKLSVQKGLAIIEALMARGDLVQAHIDAAGELGGNIVAIQTSFDAAMVSLENAKASYEAISTTLAGISASDTASVQAQFQRVRDTNLAVAKAQTDLKKVVADLKVLYGQSPWTIDRERFTNMEEM